MLIGLVPNQDVFIGRHSLESPESKSLKKKQEGRIAEDKTEFSCLCSIVFMCRDKKSRELFAPTILVQSHLP